MEAIRPEASFLDLTDLTYTSNSNEYFEKQPSESEVPCSGDEIKERFLPQATSFLFFDDLNTKAEFSAPSSSFNEEEKQETKEKTVITIQRPGKEPQQLIFPQNCEVLVEGGPQGITTITITNPNSTHESNEIIPTLEENDWMNMPIEKGNNYVRVRFEIPQQNLTPDYYKNFPKKIIDIYLMKANITGLKKRNDAYSALISEKKLRDRASIKKIAGCWHKIPQFRHEFTKFVLESISSSDMKTTQVSGKHDSKILKQCYTQMLFGLKRILAYLQQYDLINQYEPAHFWPKVVFKQRERSESGKLEQIIKEEEES